MNSVPSFIQLDSVRKVYRGRREEFLAVSNVTFDVEAGELVCMVGPSGCGKTTVLKILAGLHSYEDGTVRIGSQSDSFNPARDIGMVFQQPRKSSISASRPRRPPISETTEKAPSVAME